MNTSRMHRERVIIQRWAGLVLGDVFKTFVMNGAASEQRESDVVCELTIFNIFKLWEEEQATASRGEVVFVAQCVLDVSGDRSEATISSLESLRD